MLAIVLLMVVATVQVECAPNQLWPAFDKVSIQPTKKPVFATPINKETTTKSTLNPSATQHAYEQFINTWLRQASITLNRPDILKFVTTAFSSEQNTPVETTVGQTAVEESVVPATVLEAQDAPVEQVVETVTDESLVSGSEFVPVVEAISRQLAPVPEEQTPEVQVVADPIEMIPEVIETATEVFFVEEVNTPVREPVFPLAEEVLPSLVPEEFVPVEPIPSLVEQDTDTVLLTEPKLISEVLEVPAEPIAQEPAVEFLQPVDETPMVPEPILKEPQAEVVQPTGKSFSSVQPAAQNILPIEAVPNQQAIPIAAFFPNVISADASAARSPLPTFATAFPVAPLPAFRIPGAVTTDGLSYTLQFFPSRGRSHYFVSTAVGS